MQQSQAGPAGAEMRTFSVPAGNMTWKGDYEYSELGCYRVLCEITLLNGEKASRFLDDETSEDPRKWKPRNRLGQLKRILRDNFTSEPHAFWEPPRDNSPLGALGLWLGPSVRRDQNKVCIVARADGKGPWDLRLYNATKQGHHFSRSTPKTQPAAPQQAPNKLAGPPAMAPRTAGSGERFRRPSETSQLRSDSGETPEQAARKASASNRRPSAVSRQSHTSVKV